MKIRIQDNSVRFRITIRELEKLTTEGILISSTSFPGFADEPNVLRYGILISPSLSEGRIEFTGNEIIAELSPADLEALRDDSREGVYFGLESAESSRGRFMFFVEKDRPGSACEKPEHWIYDEAAGKPTDFRPIKTKP